MVLPPRYGLSLCAGGGGLDMGLGLAEPGFATACYVEWDEYPRSTLIAGQRAGYLHPAPIWDNVKTFNARPWGRIVDTLLAGYPCQPFSQAGQRKGEDDPRHLWPDIARIIGELGDGLRWIFLENVAGHLSLGLETVVRALQRMGFRVAVGLFSAEEAGAPHERQRVFIVAHRQSADRGREQQSQSPQRRWPGSAGSGRELANTDGWNTGTERQQRGGQQRLHPERRGSGGTDVDNAPSPRRVTARFGTGSDRQSGQRLSGTGCDELADTERVARHEERCRSRSHQKKSAGSSSDWSSSFRPNLHAPGPKDLDAWRATLDLAPDLAPALSLRHIADTAKVAATLVASGHMAQAEAEQLVCRMADGMAARTRALRLLGNGVHPLAAGYAWRTLSHAHGLGRVDLGTTHG